MAGRGDVKAGRAYVELYVRDNALSRGLKSASQKLSSWGAGLRSAGAGLAGIGASLAAPLGLAIAKASEAEETMSKFNTVFGSNAGAVKQWGDQFAASVGRGRTEIAGFLAGTQDLFVPLGFAADEAEGLSKQVTQLAVDLASFNNMADADALRDLHAALTGSGEVMKKYGVIVSEAAVKQELLRKGMDPKAATDQEKVAARLAIIMRGTTAAQSDALRTSGSFANRSKALRAELTNLAEAIGNALLPVVTPLVDWMGKAVSHATKWATANKGLIISVAAVAAGLVAAGAALISLGTTLTVVSMGLSTVATVIGVVLSPLGLLTAGLIGAGVAWVKFTDSGKAAAGVASKTFADMAAIATQSIKGIGDALMTGDLKLAADIAFAGLHAAALSALANLQDAVGGSLGDVLGGILGAEGISGAFAQIGNELSMVWTETIQGMWVGWLEFSRGIIDIWASAVAKISELILQVAKDSEVISAILEPILGVNVASEARRTAEINAQLRARGLAAGPDFMAGAGSDIARQVEAWRAAAQSAVTDLQSESAAKATAARERAEGGRFSSSATREAAEAAKRRLDELTRSAAERADAAMKAAAAAGGDGAGGGGVGGGKAAGTAVTFSAAALSLLGQSTTPQQELVKEAKQARKDRQKQLENDAKMLEELGRMVPGVFS